MESFSALGLWHIMMDVHGRENSPTSWPGLKPLFKSMYSVTCERSQRLSSQLCPPLRSATPLATPWTAALERREPAYDEYHSKSPIT